MGTSKEPLHFYLAASLSMLKFNTYSAWLCLVYEGYLSG